MSNSVSHDSPLPATADAAWRAWRAMLESKDTHFRALASLDDKYRLGGSRSLSEQAWLKQLLATHTTNVHRFKAELAALAKVDSAARDALIGLLGKVNEDMGKRPLD